MENVISAVRENALADLFKMLSILIKCPDKQILQGLLDGTIEADCCDILNELEWEDVTGHMMPYWNDIHEMSGMLEADEFFSQLRREYTRLFITPKAEEISLYEGIFLLPKRKKPDLGPLVIRSAAAMDAKDCYRHAGLLMAEQGSADHMELELEFMGFLWNRIAENGEDLELRRQQKAEFETRHMKKWMEAFFRLCEAKTVHPYYRLIGILGQELAKRSL